MFNHRNEKGNTTKLISKELSLNIESSYSYLTQLESV